MEIPETYTRGNHHLLILETVTEDDKNLYNSSIHHQQTQRKRDGRNHLRTSCVDHRKRINDPIFSENNQYGLSQLPHSIMHHESVTSNSNKETQRT